MNYVVVSDSHIRGRAILNLFKDFLPNQEGELLLGSYDMDYLLFENLEILVFDQNFYEEYKLKFNDEKITIKKLILVNLEKSKKDYKNYSDKVEIVCEDTCFEELQNILLIEEDNRENFNLKERDKSILFLLSKGLSNKEIGKRLYLSEKTIKNNLSRIYKVLNVSNRYEAIISFEHLKTKDNFKNK